jgi:hypothetical protein
MTPIDRELDAALRIDPSPSLVARVRAAAASEPIEGRWPVHRVVFAGGALAALLYVAVAGVIRPSGVPEIAPRPVLPQRAAMIWAPLSAGLHAVAPPIPIAPLVVTPPRVVISRSEMEALQRLFAGALPVSQVPAPRAEELVITEIAIEPIAFPADSEGADR